MKSFVLSTLFALVANSQASALFYSDAECSTGRCNDYVRWHMCDVDRMPESKLAFQNNDTDIFVGISLALSTRSGPFLETAQIGALCAIEQVNNDPLILPGVTVHPVFADDRPNDGVNAGLCLGQAGVKMSIGPTASSKAVNMASMGKIFGTHHIGVLPTSGLLSNKDPVAGFPTFSRVSPSDGLQTEGLISICKTYGWNRIATISTRSDSYSEGVLQSLLKAAVKNEIDVLVSAVLPLTPTPEEVELQLNQIKESGVRVVLVLTGFNQDSAVIMDVASSMGIMGEGWAYLGHEIASGNAVGWKTGNGTLGVRQFHGYTLATEPEHPYNIYKACHDAHAADTEGPFANRGFFAANPNGMGGSANDAMMLALKTIHAAGVANMGDMGLIREAIGGIEFNGCTGHVAVDEFGDRVGLQFEVTNVQPDENGVGQLVVVGLVNTLTGQVEWREDEKVLFHGGAQSPPRDFFIDCDLEAHYTRSITKCMGETTRTVSYTANEGDPQKYCPAVEDVLVECDHPNWAVSMAGIGVALFGTAIATICLFATLALWHNPVMIKGQKYFLFLFIVGGILAQIAPLFALGQPSFVTCNITSTIVSLGIVLQFSTLAIKSWRVSKILVRNKALKKIVVTNAEVGRKLGMVILVTIGILIFLLVSDPGMPYVVTKRNAADRLLDFTECKSVNGSWSVMTGFVAMLVLYTCKTSYEIRNVRSDFSEAYYIFLATYNSTICALAFFAFTSLANPTPNRVHLLQSIVVSIACSMNIALLMGPKFLSIKQGREVSGSRTSVQPTRGSVRTQAGGTTSQTNATSGAVATISGHGGSNAAYIARLEDKLRQNNIELPEHA